MSKNKLFAVILIFILSCQNKDSTYDYQCELSSSNKGLLPDEFQTFDTESQADDFCQKYTGTDLEEYVFKCRCIMIPD